MIYSCMFAGAILILVLCGRAELTYLWQNGRRGDIEDLAWL